MRRGRRPRSGRGARRRGRERERAEQRRAPWRAAHPPATRRASRPAVRLTAARDEPRLAGGTPARQSTGYSHCYSISTLCKEVTMNRKFSYVAVLLVFFGIACGSINRATPKQCEEKTNEADLRGKIAKAVP